MGSFLFFICTVGLQAAARARPVLLGGHVLLDVLRRAVPAHAAGGHVLGRVQGHASPARYRLGCAGAAGVRVRRPPDRHARRNLTVSTFMFFVFFVFPLFL